jgi:predicted cupin superfamily sugar epimerase
MDNQGLQKSPNYPVMEVEVENAQYWINALGLERHLEGGYFKETYRSDDLIPRVGLPERYPGRRYFSTSIYFLLHGTEVSHLHRIKSDELWYYHIGSSLSIHMIDQEGEHKVIRLGREVEKGEVFQGVVPAGCWFGAIVDDADSFCLVSCAVAPGFDFKDFELGDRERLLQLYPQHVEIIKVLT